MADDLPSTIIFPEAFKRSPTADNDGVYYWEWWRAAINRRGIRPTDGDAIVEINNAFLLAETKDEGVPIQDGQRRTLDALLRTGLWTVIHQIGKHTPVSWALERYAMPRREFTGGLNVDRRSGPLFDFVARWAERADSLHKHWWRKRAITAALDGAPVEVWHWLRQYLRDQHGKALGEFAETPLGRASIEKLERDLDGHE
jgi:hypothetical protein